MAPAVVDLLHQKFDPQEKQLVTAYEPENAQMFVDEDRLLLLGLTLGDLARFLEAQPFVFSVFTHDDVRRAAEAAKPCDADAQAYEVQMNPPSLHRRCLFAAA